MQLIDCLKGGWASAVGKQDGHVVAGCAVIPSIRHLLLAAARVRALARREELSATTAAEVAVVIERLDEQPTALGKAVVDEQLHARHVVGLEGGIHDAERGGGMAKNPLAPKNEI